MDPGDTLRQPFRNQVRTTTPLAPYVHTLKPKHRAFCSTHTMTHVVPFVWKGFLLVSLSIAEPLIFPNFIWSRTDVQAPKHSPTTMLVRGFLNLSYLSTILLFMEMSTLLLISSLDPPYLLLRGRRVDQTPPGLGRVHLIFPCGSDWAADLNHRLACAQ